MAYEPAEVIDLVNKHLMPLWLEERNALDRIDRWARWDHDRPHQPRQSTLEYRQLADRSTTPWGDLLVASLVQAMYVDGYRSGTAADNGKPWLTWQANGMDRRQIAVNRAFLTYGSAYGLTLPGQTLAGDPMPKMRGVSPREMIALFEDPADDEWPVVAMRVCTINRQRVIRVYDDQYQHTLAAPNGPGAQVSYDITQLAEHGAGVCPVVRFANRLDLEGRYAGEIEPFISILGRIDQTTFDRLVVQRFASWIVRTIAGMAKPDPDTDAAAEKLRLKVEDILIAEDPNTKFGSLPASDMGGFINAHDSDIRVLAAVSQSPAHEMLGQMANLSAEALDSARASQSAKADERRYTAGETYEQWLRLTAHLAGDDESASDFSAQVRWKDTQIRSLAQAADALGKLATMLGIPPEVLWEKVPGFTQQDIDRAKELAKQSGGLDQMLQQLIAGQTSKPTPGPGGGSFQQHPSGLLVPAAA